MATTIGAIGYGPPLGTFEDVTTTDDLTVGDDLTVTDDATITGTLTVADTATVSVDNTTNSASSTALTVKHTRTGATAGTTGMGVGIDMAAESATNGTTAIAASLDASLTTATLASAEGRLEVRAITAGAQPAEGAGQLIVDGNSRIVLGTNAAVATSSTAAGLVYFPSCAGLPTGAASAVTGKTPLLYDSTNGRMLGYTSGTWTPTWNDGSQRSIGLYRAQNLLGSMAVREVGWIDFAIDATYDAIATANTGTGANSNQGLPGGIWSFSSGGTAGGVSTWTIATFAMANVAANKFYCRTRARFVGHPGGGGSLFPIHFLSSAPRVIVGCGINDATSSTNFTLIGCLNSGTSPNVTTSVTSTVAIETANYHVLEMWSDNTNFYLSVDGETAVSCAIGSTATNGLQIGGGAYNLAITETDQLFIDYAQIFTLSS